MDFNKLSIKDVDVKDKRVFIRVDYNVPQDKTGKITSTARIDASIPTLKFCLEHGAKALIIASHLGRPAGKGFEDKFSMKPVQAALEKIMGQKVLLLNDCVGEEVEKQCVNPTEKLILLENLRFHPEEQDEKEESEAVLKFRKSLRALADIYCDDAFGTAHRPHSSMVGQFYEVRCSGFLMEKEINFFKIAMTDPKRPYLAILGGAKVSDKIKLIKNLIPKINTLIISGGMAYTFLKKLNKMEIGKSLFDKPGFDIVDEIMEMAKKYNVDIHLPCDHVIANEFKNEAQNKIVTTEEGVPEGWMGMDIGPKSCEEFQKIIMQAKTILWNGPPGVFEMENFSAGTKKLIEYCSAATKAGCVTIVGGGDSATAVDKAKATDKFSHVSTGGGASIELLEGNILPGVERLSNKK